MAEKMLGKHANRLGQARGQFSSQSHEPFLRKCLYKESGPEILATTYTKGNRKNHEKVRNRFLSFGGTCWLCFKKGYRLVPSQKNL